MRVRYVLLNAYAMGGTARSVINQANALCATHDIEIASVHRTREQPVFPLDPRVRLVPLTDRRADRWRLADWTRRLRNPLPHRRDYRFRPWDPALDLRLLRYFWTAGDGILVTTRPGLSLLCAALAPRRLIRVAQDHRSLGSYHPAVRQALLRAYRRFDAVTVLTGRDHAAYRQALAGSAARLAHIPNAVPRPRRPAAELTAKVIVAAGRLRPEKGFDLLLDAFQQVAARHPDWQLWIFGSGAQKAALADRIDRLGLAGRAHLKGATGRLDAKLAAASMFVLSSRHEGLPMVLLEAMAAGLPAIALDHPTGAAEVITHGRNGLVVPAQGVPAQDVPALAAAICQLIEDPATRREMGAAAAAATGPFSTTTVARRWEQLFSDLVRARSTTRPATGGRARH